MMQATDFGSLHDSARVREFDWPDMRRILVDHARARGYQKRGGGAQRVTLDEAMIVEGDRPDLIAVDDAITALGAADARKAQVVELRFFAGLSVEETAAALHLSVDTVMRDWKAAKAWLARELTGRAPS